jgi:hypothetical protein
VAQRELRGTGGELQPGTIAAEHLQPRGRSGGRPGRGDDGRAASSRCSQRSSASTAATVARTRVSTWGLATWSPPVTSMAPSSTPVTGWCTGAAEQLHGCTGRR